MKPITLSILLGACAASAWWAAATWPHVGNGVLWALSALLSLAVVLIIIAESIGDL